MSTKQAVLGLLADRRGYRYDLMLRLNDRLGPSFALNPSSVYRALDELERDRLVQSTRGASADPAPLRTQAADRRMYDITPAGLDSYESWIRTPPNPGFRRGELVLRIAVSRPQDAEPLLAALDRYEVATLEALEAHARSRDRGPAAAPGSWTLSSAALAHERGTRLLHAEIEWVRDVRSAVHEIRARLASAHG